MVWRCKKDEFQHQGNLRAEYISNSSYKGLAAAQHLLKDSREWTVPFMFGYLSHEKGRCLPQFPQNSPLGRDCCVVYGRNLILSHRVAPWLFVRVCTKPSKSHPPRIISLASAVTGGLPLFFLSTFLILVVLILVSSSTLWNKNYSVLVTLPMRWCSTISI